MALIFATEPVFGSERDCKESQLLNIQDMSVTAPVVGMDTD
jgi:hypothetical protein